MSMKKRMGSLWKEVIPYSCSPPELALGDQSGNASFPNIARQFQIFLRYRKQMQEEQNQILQSLHFLCQYLYDQSISDKEFCSWTSSLSSEYSKRISTTISQIFLMHHLEVIIYSGKITQSLFFYIKQVS